MDGVTILNEIVEPITEINPTAIVISIVIIFTLGMVLGVILGIVKYIQNCKRFDSEVIEVGILGFMLGLFIGFFISIFIYFANQIKIGEDISYEIIVDNKVLMQEFYEKYEIIDQRGQIYVVKEKSKDDK